MELTELQAMWQQHDKILSENTRINKEILKQILISKPEKRLNREKIRAGINLILPIVLISVVLVPYIKYRHSIDFYLGAIMFFGFSTFTYYGAVRYFMLLRKVDLANPITSIKKNVKQLEKHKFKFTKVAYILSPVNIVGIFLLGKIPVFSGQLTFKSLLPLFLIIMVMFISIYYTFKYRIFEYYRNLDKEIAEIEKLEEE